MAVRYALGVRTALCITRSNHTAQVGMTGGHRQDGQCNVSNKRSWKGPWQWRASGQQDRHFPINGRAWHQHQFKAELGIREALVRSKILLHLQARKMELDKDLQKLHFCSSFWYHFYNKSEAPSVVRPRPHRDMVLYEYQSKQSSTSSLLISHSAPLLCIDVPSRPNLDPPVPTGPLPSDQIRQVILVHEVPLALPAVLVGAALVLALVLGQDEVLAPVALAAALHARHLAVGGAVHRLGDAVDVAALVVLEVALEVQLHLARGVGAAARPRQRRLPALGAELLVHLPRHVEAPVAAQDPGLELLDAAEIGGGDEAGAES